MLLDAIVLAGGRSSRLGGEPKQHLIVGGRSLLHRTLDAAREAGALRIVVVGEPALAVEIAGAGADRDAGAGADRDAGAGWEAEADVGAGWDAGAGADWDAGAGAHSGVRIDVVREEPAFGGPAAGIAAGVRALAAGPSDATSRRTLVLACDMPGCAEAVSALVRAAEADAAAAADGAAEVGVAARVDAASAPAAAARVRGDGRRRADGFVAVDASGRRQHLLALYDAVALNDAVQRMGSRLDGLAVRTLTQELELREVAIPPGAADDIDTWDDAERLGAGPPTERRSSDEF